MLKSIRNLLVLGVAALLNARSRLVKRLVYDSWGADYFISNGPEVFVVESRDRIVGRQLYQVGDFEIWKLQVAMEICRENGHPVRFLIDAGANIGTTIIPALKRGWFDGGVAIEPHPDNIRLLRANSSLNDVDFTIHQLAVGEEPADVFLAESNTNSGAHKISSEGIPVRCERLDEIVPTTPDGTMLWMDIQGMKRKPSQVRHAFFPTESLSSSSSIPPFSKRRISLEWRSISMAGGCSTWRPAANAPTWTNWRRLSRMANSPTSLRSPRDPPLVSRAFIPGKGHDDVRQSSGCHRRPFRVWRELARIRRQD